MSRERQEGLGRRVDRLLADVGQSADIVLVYGSGRHELVRPNWCWFYSGVRQIGLDACLVLARDEPPLLIVTPSWDAKRARHCLHDGEVLACDDIAVALVELGARRNWSGRNAALIGFSDAPAAIAAVAAGLFRDVTNDPDVLPSTQDGLGLSQIRRALDAAERAVADLAEIVRPGICEDDLVALCLRKLRDYGSDANFLVLSASPHHFGPSPPSGRHLEDGDIVLAEVSPSIDGQYAQICRTLVVGSPRDSVARNHAILEESFDAALRAGKPGAEPAALMRAANQVIAAHGFGDYNGPRYMRARGHAVGLGPMCPAIVSEQATYPLETGMSFVLHPNQYFPDSGYLFYGTQVVMTDTGLERMSEARARLDGSAEPAC